jgi:hypothetical protein
METRSTTKKRASNLEISHSTVQGIRKYFSSDKDSTRHVAKIVSSPDNKRRRVLEPGK